MAKKKKFKEIKTQNNAKKIETIQMPESNLFILDLHFIPDILSAFLTLCIVVLSLYISYVSFKPYYGSVLMKEGQALINAQKYEDAINKLNQSLSFDSYNGNVYFFLGMAYQKMKKFKEALNAYNTVKKYADTPHLHVNLGAIYYYTEQWEKAKKEYEKAIKIYPSYAVPYYNLALIYTREERYKEAEKMLKELLKIDPNYPDTNRLLAATYEKLNNATAALKQYQVAMNTPKNNVSEEQTYFNFAVTQMKNNNLEMAIDYFKKVLKLNPNNYRAMNNIGAIYVREGKYDESITILEQALKINPNYFEAMLNAGIAYQKKGRFDVSLTYFNRVLAGNPKEVEKNKANLLSAYSLFYLGKIAEAKEKINKVPPDFPGAQELKKRIESQ